MLVLNSIPDSTDEYNNTVKRLWNDYMALEYGIEYTPEQEKDQAMLDYYNKVVKNVKAELVMIDGKVHVKGLEALGAKSEVPNKPP